MNPPNLESIAAEVLKCGLAHEPGVRLIGNVMAWEIVALAASSLESCPKCGATAWVNIDCIVCVTCTVALQGGAA